MARSVLIAKINSCNFPGDALGYDVVGIPGRPLRRFVFVGLLFAGLATAETIGNWRANFPPCKQHSELLKRGPMNLGVRVATANPVLAEEFRAAMDFWAKVLDLEWYEERTQNCSVEVIDGERWLFEPEPENMAARSQFPDRRDFEGWIAFNPTVALTRMESYRISVHEIGHMLGLRHSTNIKSLMYGFDMDDSQSLDTADLAFLAERHKLRIASLSQPVLLTKPQ
jgi:hypothetical protein